MSGLKLELSHITKTFPGVLACDDVSLTVRPGEAMAIIGENGAGKTTLMNMIIGLYTPDRGKILLDGVETHFSCPEDALSQDIGMVHQRYMLVPDITVWENVALAMRGDASKDIRLDKAAVCARIDEISSRYGLAVNPDAFIWQLSVGEQQRVELVKTLCLGARLLILDEPTSALTPQETEDLIQLLRQMRGDVTLLFISHKLAEVKALCDEMLVMRSGRAVFSGKTADYTAAEIAEKMTGRVVNLTMDQPARHVAGEALVVEGLRVKGDRGNFVLDGLNLTVREGEIVGLAGVSGNGQRELAESLCGLRKIRGGRASLYGQSLVGKTPAQIIAMGMGYIPEERNVEGVVPTLSIRENLILKDVKKFASHGFLRLKDVEKNAHRLTEAFDVRASSVEESAGNLSGGNIQKVILAREISRNPRFLIAVYPIRGLDMGAAEFIHNELIKLRDSGVGILLISEEMDELMNVADRIAVIFKGNIQKIMDKKEATAQKIGLLMAGVKDDEE